MTLSKAFLKRREDREATRVKRDANGEEIPRCLFGATQHGKLDRVGTNSGAVRCRLCGAVWYAPARSR